MLCGEMVVPGDASRGTATHLTWTYSHGMRRRRRVHCIALRRVNERLLSCCVVWLANDDGEELPRSGSAQSSSWRLSGQARRTEVSHWRRDYPLRQRLVCNTTPSYIHINSEFTSFLFGALALLAGNVKGSQPVKACSTNRKGSRTCWRYVALVVVLWRSALSSSSVTTLRWEPVNVHV